jgi:p-cymene monooxygenase electron transfer component
MFSLFKSLLGKQPARVAEVLPFGTRFEVPSGQTLLESALANNVAFPHNCTVGTCGSCKCRLKVGRVKAITDFGYTLSKEELEAGYILACQAVPRDELTVVEVEAQAANMPAPEKFTGHITCKEILTHDIVRVTIALDRPLKFIAGQYANLSARHMARGRFYSFADAPQANGHQNISFFIRKIPGGAFTEALFRDEMDAIELDIDAPHGSFHLRQGAAPMVCVAGGSGLAPLLSLLQDASQKRIERRCVLLFGARTQADLYALEQIAAIAQSWSGGFAFVPVLSDEPADSNWTGARGLVTELIEASLPQLRWHEAEGYMCGPPRMIDSGVSVLTGLGVRLESIHYDKFVDESHGAAQT